MNKELAKTDGNDLNEDVPEMFVPENILSKRGKPFDSLPIEAKKLHMKLERDLRRSVQSGVAIPFDLDGTKRKLKERLAQKTT